MRRYNFLWITAGIIMMILSSSLMCSAETEVEAVKLAGGRVFFVSTDYTKNYTFDSYLAPIRKGRYQLVLIIINRKTGKKIHDAVVSFKITTPGGKEIVIAEATEIGAYKYGAELSMPEKGKYVFTCTAKIKGRQEVAKLEYEVD